MKKTLALVVLSLFIPDATRTQTQSKAGSGGEKKAGAPTIDVIRLNISDETLKLSYQIKNDSDHDIWICEGICVGLPEHSFEVYLAEDKHTLLVRKRLDITAQSSPIAYPSGRYVRLPAGQSRAESLLLSLPVESRFFWGAPPEPDKPYTTSLALEIGYYPGDMPGMIRGIFEEAEKSSDTKTGVYPTYPITIKVWLGSLLLFDYYNSLDQYVSHRGEEFVIPWTGEFRIGEQALRTTIDGLRIPYEETFDLPDVSPPDINNCTRLEIQYQPSMLDYFFPYPNERAFLSAEEVRHLQSLETTVADDQERIKAFAHEVGEGLPGGIFTERTTARVICYRDGERLTSFTIYDDRSIVTEEQQCLRYSTGLPGLKALTTQIKPFDLRMRCAANLTNLRKRFGLYPKAAKSLRIGLLRRRIDKPYPETNKWCDYMVKAYKSAGIGDEGVMSPHKCPSASQGKSHYAMNPNCKFNSPADMVLLFETKAGWNQHGGPELFTFDNHDPKGGCVLLNDGTVKFIRTKEELRNLRWK